MSSVSPMRLAPRVLFITRVLTHYREPFNQGLRAALAAVGIAYDLIAANISHAGFSQFHEPEIDS